VPTVVANGTETFYECLGSGPPLVLVHGACVDHWMWDPQVEHLATRYRVIRYDLRGHGKTRTLDKRPYTVALLADDLAALLDALGVERAIVCGASLGGMVGQSFAVAHPQRLLALVLVGTAISTSLTWSDKLQRVLFPRWLMPAMFRLLGVGRFVRFSFWLAAVTRSEAWLGHDPATRRYVAETMLRMDAAACTDIYRAVYDFGPVDLASIAAPTLIVNGEHEGRGVFRHAAEMERRIASAEAVVIPGAGHLANMERPDAFNRAVARFLDRALTRPDG